MNFFKIQKIPSVSGNRCLGFFLVFILISHPISKEAIYNFDFVVWNVGQGSWATWLQPNECFHFDMGGEFSPIKQVYKLCGRKMNHIYLTHLDYDHIRFIKKFMLIVPRLCLHYPKPSKKSWMKKIKPCSFPSKKIRQISLGKKGNDSNAGSIVYLIAKQVLITGDAPISQELKWYKQTPRRLKVLILGHHGSKTSTSVKLLDWVQPQMAVSSARKTKYGHPHPKVIRKLNQRKIPLLKTEILGHLFFKLQ